jgi:hypothetical protein
MRGNNMIYSKRILYLISILFVFLVLNSEKCESTAKGYSFIINSPKWVNEGKDSILEVSSTIVNNSKDTLRYQSEAGGWDEYYLVDNDQLEIYFPRDEFTGSKFFVTLLPGKSRMVYLPLRRKNGINKFHWKFKIGMVIKNAQAKQVLWSNSIEI